MGASAGRSGAAASSRDGHVVDGGNVNFSNVSFPFLGVTTAQPTIAALPGSALPITFLITAARPAFAHRTPAFRPSYWMLRPILAKLHTGNSVTRPSLVRNACRFPDPSRAPRPRTRRCRRVIARAAARGSLSSCANRRLEQRCAASGRTTPLARSRGRTYPRRPRSPLPRRAEHMSAPPAPDPQPASGGATDDSNSEPVFIGDPTPAGADPGVSIDGGVVLSGTPGADPAAADANAAGEMHAGAEASRQAADMSSDDWKKQGNAAFQAQDYDNATLFYSNGIELEPTNAALFSNRSAAYLKQGDTAKARRDADMCVELDKYWPKGWWRRGQAQLEAQEYADARNTFREGLTYCAGDDNLTRGLENAEKRVAVLEAVQGKPAEAPFDPDAPSTRGSTNNRDTSGASLDTDAPKDGAESSVFPGLLETEIRRIQAAPNHYATLHVSPDASASQMKKNYHILARMLHPDKCDHPDASEAMSQVSLAYDTLTNVMKKTLYDQFMSQAGDGDKEQTYAEWEAKQQPVELPKWLSWLLAIKGCGWILAIVLLILILPVVLIVVVLFLILWCICCPYRTALRYCFPEKYARMKEDEERERAKAEEAAQDRQFP